MESSPKIKTEPRAISEVFQEMLLPVMLGSTAVNEWDNVELTDDEVADALASARRMKWERNREAMLAAARAEYRAEMLRPWAPEEYLFFLKNDRAVRCGFSANGGGDGKPVFEIDDRNVDAIKAMCYYFCNHPHFEQMAMMRDGELQQMGWKLSKGLLLCGGVGTGKTKLMQMMSRNQRACFDVVPAMGISRQFSKDGEGVIELMSDVHHYEIKDLRWFNHEAIGLCIDDLGTEEEKNFYGNKTNVIAEILLGRYANHLPFNMTHITTNLSADGVQAYYGPRVWSRIKEMFNVIDLTGSDRRK